jgi:hypothetical protein
MIAFMKNLPALSLALVSLLLASCASPIVRRIENNPEIYAKLSDRHKALVQAGKVEEGMTKQAVFLSWGQPNRAAKGSKQGKTYERWSYTGYDAVPTPSIGFGYGYGGYYGGRGRHSYADSMFYYEPSYQYVPYESARVEFLNSKVSEWSVAR